MTDSDLQTFDSLTKRQRQVLDLLVEYKTSKEIGILIGISYNTVDQHIDVCRKKLGATNRKDLARIYKSLTLTCQKTTYEQLRIANPLLISDSPHRSEAERMLILERSNSDELSELHASGEHNSAISKSTRGYWEPIALLGAIIIFAIFIVVSVP